jgi:hypothetical protein
LFTRAAAAADVDPGLVTDPSPDDLESVRIATEEGMGLGVVTTPTLYRDGPVLAVRVNPAAVIGDAAARLATIEAVLVDDGIWELRKP